MAAFSRIVVLFTVAAALACGGAHEIENVLLVSIDTCRADALGCYGSDTGATPNLDEFAAGGGLFETAISPVPITMPAHSSLFTGLNPQHHGVRGNLRHRLDPGLTTLAETLAERVDSSVGVISSRVLDRRFGIAQGFDHWDDELVATRRSIFGAERRGGETMDRAIGWLESHAEGSFFLFVHLYDPHEPYEPPEPWASRFADNPYLGEVAYADAEIGRLLETLHELGLDESTAVVVVGDHGELLGEHGELTHTYFVYRNAVRVPLIMRVPGIAGGRRIAGTVGLVDVMPTLLGLLGASPVEGDGRDLSALLRGETEGDPERPIYCESLTPTRYGANPLRAVATSRQSYIRTNHPELYDLELDPEESDNLIDEHPQEARRWEAILVGMMSEGTVVGSDPNFEVDPEVARQLAALGYMSSAIDTAVDLDPERPDPKDLIALHVAHQRTFLAMADGRWDEAEAACLTVLDALPDFYEAAGNLAKIKVGQRRWAESLPLLERALALKPDQYEIVHDQGLALTELGELEEAADAFRRAVELDPSPPTGELNLSRALFNLGETREALDHARSVAEKAPNNPVMLRLLGSLLLDFGQAEPAVPVLEGVVGLDPDDLETRNTLGLLLASSGDLDAARTQFEMMLEYDPGHAGAHLNLGMIALEQGRGMEAIEAAASHFAEAVRLDPNLPAGHLNLAITSLEQGRTGEAMASLRRSLELEPDQPAALDQLAWLLIDAADPSLRDPAEAVELAERACALTRFQEPSLLSTLATAHAAAGNTDEAAAVSRRVGEIARLRNRPELARQLEHDLATHSAAPEAD
ncbi:MAG: sulfatase-like hydrolase/transferase [Acidobacteriota bacterium]